MIDALRRAAEASTSPIQPDLLEREREINADRGLAYAALAAAHRDDVADPR